MFGNGGRQHMELYGTTAEQFAKVSVRTTATGEQPALAVS